MLDGLPSERRGFLLHTAALGVLTGNLCDALLETQGSAGVLAELEREQFFTTTSDGGLTYHYHQVLQTHLEVLLIDELGGRAARELYARSGRLLEEAGRPAEAVRAHARAEDWGAVARLMRPDTTVVGGDDTLWRMLALPGAPTDDPGLVLAGARRLARDGQVEKALAAYREAERLLDDPGFGRRCAAERQAVGVWLPQSATSALPPVPPGADAESALLRLSIELRRLTRDVRRPESYDRGWLRGLAYLLSGDLDTAERLLAVPWTPGDGAVGWETLAAELVGCLAQAIRAGEDHLVGQIETITLTAEMDGWPWLARLGRCLQTVVQLDVGVVDGRVEAAADLLASLARGSDRWSLLVAAVGIAITARRAGAESLAADASAQVARLTSELGAPALAGVIDQLGDVASPAPVPAMPHRRLRRSVAPVDHAEDRAALPRRVQPAGRRGRDRLASAASEGALPADAAGPAPGSSAAPGAADRGALAGGDVELGGPQSAGRGLQHPPVPGGGRRGRRSDPPAGRRVRAGAPGSGGRRDRVRADRRGGTTPSAGAPR